MKSKRGWASAFCCFLLFIVVCLSLALKMKGAFRASGHPELGLLFFVIPGAVASFVSRKRQVLLPLMGAMLAAPLCFVLMRMVIAQEREFWQELAWLFSAVFWCALGALCYLFVSSMMSKKGRS
ncbi:MULTISPECIES: inner membrane protein YbjM [unclassified Enterobacter]|uniref:inner membrane protein YbjM n=1 Tax=unclassified Enterobacter TaxID=2608935 RepID=UPI000934740D|nr:MULTISPECIES: inner membrane protein YbjM [unclassified Enterobacter]WJD48029.1 inner membrane protein YbjM [Enterobacter sp. PGRG2]